MNTDKQQEALKLALEALEETLRTLDDENAKPGGAISDTIWYSEHETLFDYLTTQITAIREALAHAPTVREQRSGIKQVIELYDSPEQPAQQEPLKPKFVRNVDGVPCITLVEHEHLMRFRTSPPASKPWVPLTEFDIDQIPYSCSHADSRLIAFAIEAKLKERNT